MNEALQRKLNERVMLEAQILSAVIGALNEQKLSDQWSPRELTALRSALAIASEANGANNVERAKAERLKRHLFLENPIPDAILALYKDVRAPGHVADRIRADLADLVPYGAGLYLIDYKQAAKAWLTKVA